MSNSTVEASHIGVQMEAPLTGISVMDISRWAEIALGEESRDVCVRITGPRESQNLNLQYRNIDQPTNVLAFTTNSSEILGDIVICADVAIEESNQQHKPLKNHVAHLVVHGILHLCGMDHIHDVDSANMEKKEVHILNSLGIPNPYE